MFYSYIPAIPCFSELTGNANLNGLRNEINALRVEHDKLKGACVFNPATSVASRVTRLLAVGEVIMGSSLDLIL